MSVLLSRFSQLPSLSKRLLARTCRGRPLTASHKGVELPDKRVPHCQSAWVASLRFAYEGSAPACRPVCPCWWSLWRLLLANAVLHGRTTGPETRRSSCGVLSQHSQRAPPWLHARSAHTAHDCSRLEGWSRRESAEPDLPPRTPSRPRTSSLSTGLAAVHKLLKLMLQVRGSLARWSASGCDYAALSCPEGGGLLLRQATVAYRWAALWMLDAQRRAGGWWRVARGWWWWLGRLHRALLQSFNR